MSERATSSVITLDLRKIAFAATALATISVLDERGGMPVLALRFY